MNRPMGTPRALLAIATACLALDAAASPAWSPDVPSEWTMIRPGPVELGGTIYQPTCSGLPGTDPGFHFWVKRGSVDAVVVFLTWIRISIKCLQYIDYKAA